MHACLICKFVNDLLIVIGKCVKVNLTKNKSLTSKVGDHN